MLRRGRRRWRAQAVTGSQHAIERGRRAAALHVSQNNGSRFESGPFFNLGGQQIANSAQAFVPELKLPRGADHLGSLCILAGRELRSLRYHNDIELLAPRVPLLQGCRHFIDFKGMFRNKNGVRAAGHAAIKRNPAGIPSHDLDHDGAVMGFRRGVKAIDGLGDDIYRGIKTEGEVSACQIVVDRFRHADHFAALFMQLLRD